MIRQTLIKHPSPTYTSLSISPHSQYQTITISGTCYICPIVSSVSSRISIQFSLFFSFASPFSMMYLAFLLMKSVSISGFNGGGEEFRSVDSGTDSDEIFIGAVSHHRKFVLDGVSSSTTNPSISGHATHEEESSLWKSIIER